MLITMHILTDGRVGTCITIVTLITICIPFHGHIKGTASAIYAILHCIKCKFKAPGNILLSSPGQYIAQAGDILHK